MKRILFLIASLALLTACADSELQTNVVDTHNFAYTRGDVLPTITLEPYPTWMRSLPEQGKIFVVRNEAELLKYIDIQTSSLPKIDFKKNSLLLLECRGDIGLRSSSGRLIMQDDATLLLSVAVDSKVQITTVTWKYAALCPVIPDGIRVSLDIKNE